MGEPSVSHGDELILRRVVVATRSAGKLRELAPLLAAQGWTALSLDAAGVPERRAAEDALEVHDTFEANAMAKARYFHALSGLPTIADDSGLMVDALNGAPGVYSKRWSARPDLEGAALDAENNAQLLRALSGVGDRGAAFVCAAAWVDATRAVVTRGEVRGRLLEAPEGDGGFGYDPLFFSVELGRAFGVLDASAKAAVSHRARAVKKLLEKVCAGS